MEPTAGDGPDDSSLGPVSSLRARFETINKPAEGSPLSTKAPSRPISPAPKPDRLRDFKPTQDHDVVSAPVTPTPSTPVVPTRPKDRPKPPAITPARDAETAPPRPPPPPASKPSLAAKPPPPPASKPTPSVTVQPPQSPPKNTVTSTPTPADDRPAFLNPDSLSAASTPVKSPARPTTPTPTIPPPRSPRPAKAPSPPPPRRSAEIRREPKQAPPPPAPRREKTTVLEPSPENHGPAGGVGPQATQKAVAVVSSETSPFSSPPTSPEADPEEAPPQLPARPRPNMAERPAARPLSTAGQYAPPPVHHSVAYKRRGPETNGFSGNGHVAHKDDDVFSGSLPKTRTDKGAPRPASMQFTSPPQHNPTRPISMNITHHTESQAVVASTPPNRVASHPTIQQLPMAPPPRPQGRQQAVDRTHADNGEAPAQTAVAPRTLPTAQAPTSRGEGPVVVSAFPECSSTNRRPPYMKKTASDIQTKYDPRIFDVCGELVCTSGQLTRLWNIVDGEMLMSLSHTEGIKATAIAFKPATDPETEGSAVWIGTNMGELMEVDLTTQTITNSKGGVHQRRPVIKIYRRSNELWTLDEAGTLLVWGPDETTGVPNVTGNPHQSFKVPKDYTFAMVVGDELWHATGRELRVFAPTVDGRVQFQVLIRPLVAEGCGDVTSGTTVKGRPGKVYFGHADGKISIFSKRDYTCVGIITISTWKVNALAGVGHRLWVGYNTGKICVYDMSETPWSILKEWQAHANPVLSMKCDAASAYKIDCVQVVTLGADNRLRTWDGLLEDDWVEDDMKSKDVNYCDFDELRALVFTWNAGASTPHSLRYSGADGEFFPHMIQSSGSPDILIFGFQELVDLEDKTATAKRFLKGKKKEGTAQENMSHQYRDWKNFLMKTLDDYMPAGDLYHLLHTAPMVGLFTCVFVKASLRDRIRNISGAEVKRGMGGLHGNKGAVAVRFQIDDTSLCFVNCHLAAGQTQTAGRNNDVGAVLESSLFPAEPDHSTRIDSFSGGGDGTMIVDHELCILNGDLNYRIDTMSRDTVVGAVKQNNLSKLLERDQLLVSRRRNPAFRLRAFEEMPITFAPTYKYDVGTDQYDTSEKRRSPAWCDRILFRGRGRVQQLDYSRHEVYVSDHRPVTGSFRLWVKKVRPKDRAKAWMESQQSFEDVRQREIASEQLNYLMNVCRYDEATSKRLMKARGAT